MTMTPTHTETPLRRSEVGVFRTPMQPAPEINDDEAERREARRRTILDTSTSSSTIEQNETLKRCLQLYHDNKLSKENVWSMSVIDAVSVLLDKHHKSLSNFKVAGSSLEASSKVYGLRVDCIHTDVLRLSSGLNKQKFTEVTEENDDDDSVPNAAEGNQGGEPDRPTAPPVKKRAKRHMSTITKNKETINGRLDTNPFTDPIFAKLNSIVGSINSSNRLLQNILSSNGSELRLRMDNRFWDSEANEPITIQDEYDYSESRKLNGTVFERVSFHDALLRPEHSGYVIKDTPAEQDDDEDMLPPSPSPPEDNYMQSDVAFDMNADVEPIVPSAHTLIDVDMDAGEFDELTVEEQMAINNCKGLRRKPVVIEDMRPVDSTSSQLEYSYRPLDKISQFWAGPSHWKFKRSRGKSLSIAQRFSGFQSNIDQAQRQRNARSRNTRALRFRTQHVPIGEIEDSQFQSLDERSTKMRKTNVQKKWDPKKYKLPTDLQIDKDSFDTFLFCPGVSLHDINQVICDTPPQSNEEDFHSDPMNNDFADADDLPMPDTEQTCDLVNQTVAEIATEFEGAPDKVTKIIVPFARRAKVVDMKQLKKCCTRIISKELMETLRELEPQSDFNEHYVKGFASFNSVYTTLPTLLTNNMCEALSPAVAFYSILHLANELDFRLLGQDDRKDFKIRQIEKEND